MAGSSFIQIPSNVADDPATMVRFLQTLIEYIDIAFGNRKSEVDASEFKEFLSKLEASELYTGNPKQTSPGLLNQTITGPTIAEVQAISTKLDIILTKLTAANIF